MVAKMQLLLKTVKNHRRASKLFIQHSFIYLKLINSSNFCTGVFEVNERNAIIPTLKITGGATVFVALAIVVVLLIIRKHPSKR